MEIRIDHIICTDGMRQELYGLSRRALSAGSAGKREQDRAERLAQTAYDCCLCANRNRNQTALGAWAGSELCGFVIAAKRAADDRELDWLLVDPSFHGHNVAESLMTAALEWLNPMRPVRLNTIRYDGGSIRFYQRFGFRADKARDRARAHPHMVLRRPAMPLH